MTTPLATIADALIEFILSLLRDPNAAAEFEQDPGAALDGAGLGDICAEDVRAVVPVIVDRPDVVGRQVYEPSFSGGGGGRPVGPSKPAPEPPPQIREVVKEITTIAQNFHIDNRSTIIDQSVNQNIWAQGDVNQIFDQEAVVASGDDSVAAGNDATIVNTDTDITVGDVNIGNEHTDIDIDDSFNEEDIDTDTHIDTDGSYNEANADVDVDKSTNNTENTTVDVDVSDSYNDTVAVVDTDVSYDNSGNAYSPDAYVDDFALLEDPVAQP